MKACSTPEPVPVVDLSTPEPEQLVALVVDLSTPKPDQLVAAFSVSARALAMSQLSSLRAPAIDSRAQSVLSQRPHPRRNLITVGWHITASRTPNTHTARNGIMEEDSCSRSSWPALPGFLGLKSTRSISGSMSTLLSHMELLVMYVISIVRLSQCC